MSEHASVTRRLIRLALSPDLKPPQSSPKADSPFPPAYYPGVTNRAAAAVVHISRGEIKGLELPLPEVAAARQVHFAAIGLDGQPLKTVYVQPETCDILEMPSPV